MPTQKENTTNVILHNNDNPMGHTPFNMDVPCHEGGVRIENTNTSPSVDPEANRIHGAEHSGGTQTAAKSNDSRDRFHNGRHRTQCNYTRERGAIVMYMKMVTKQTSSQR
jgi:hypothetical protein